MLTVAGVWRGIMPKGLVLAIFIRTSKLKLWSHLPGGLRDIENLVKLGASNMLKAILYTESIRIPAL